MAKKKYDPTAYVKPTAPTAPAAYQSIGNYTPVQNTVGEYTPGTYTSKYADQLQQSRDAITNWKYDPMQDASYQALAKVYGARGNIAAKNTLADAAALNGGYGTSYAVSAAQQARNQYNQELAALIPDLEASAYNRATTNYNLWKDAEDTDYGRFRDTEGDRQWKYTQDYTAYRDREADNQWLYSQRTAENQFQYNANYQRYQDALDQYQWGKDYDLGLYQLKQAEKGSGGGGGGGRRGSGGGGGGYYGGGSGSGDNGNADATPKYTGNKTPYTTQNTKNTKYTQTDATRAVKDIAAYSAASTKKKQKK